MAKIKMKHSVTVADTFADFLAGKKAAGVSEKTLPCGFFIEEDIVRIRISPFSPG